MDKLQWTADCINYGFQGVAATVRKNGQASLFMKLGVWKNSLKSAIIIARIFMITIQTAWIRGRRHELHGWYRTAKLDMSGCLSKASRCLIWFYGFSCPHLQGHTWGKSLKYRHISKRYVNMCEHISSLHLRPVAQLLVTQGVMPGDIRRTQRKANRRLRRLGVLNLHAAPARECCVECNRQCIRMELGTQRDSFKELGSDVHVFR